MRFSFQCCRRGPIFLVALVVLIVLGAGFGYAWIGGTRVCNVARRFINARDFDSALQVLGPAEGKDSSAEVAYLAAVAYRRNGDVREARRFLRRAAELKWAGSDIELQRCLLVAQSGQVAEAEPRLAEIMQSDVDDHAAEQICEAMAKGHMIAFEMQKAMDCLDNWLRWQPNAPRAHMWRAEIYRRGQQAELAIKDYGAVLERDPSNYEAKFEMAKTMVEANDVAAGHKLLLECLEVKPDDPVVLANLAQSSRRLGELDQCVNFANRAIASDPPKRSRITALTELGQVQLAQGKASEAIKTFSQVIELDPGTLTVHYSLSRAYMLLGDKEAAKRSEREAQKVWNQDTRSFEILQRLKDEPGNIELRVELALILYQQKQVVEAKRWLQSALLVDPHHRQAKETLARINDGTLAVQDTAEATPSNESAGASPPNKR